jgi:uncharacterized protein
MNLKILLRKLIWIPRKAAILAIRFYQLTFSPEQRILGTHRSVCRFYPSCSSYSLQAIERFGILKGGWLAAKRIAKCQPFGKSGWDPVPKANDHLLKIIAK